MQLGNSITQPESGTRAPMAIDEEGAVAAPRGRRGAVLRRRWRMRTPSSRQICGKRGRGGVRPGVGRRADPVTGGSNGPGRRWRSEL
jgi:hypothetical protein